MSKKLIYIDLHREQEKNSFLLDTLGTKKDLEFHHISLIDGNKYLGWTDDSDIENKFDPIIVPFTAKYDQSKCEWYAQTKTNKIKHYSELNLIMKILLKKEYNRVKGNQI